MRPYAPDTSKGRTVARDDIHHKTQDKHGNASRESSAKAMRHAARQESRRMSNDMADFLAIDRDEMKEFVEDIHDFMDACHEAR